MYTNENDCDDDSLHELFVVKSTLVFTGQTSLDALEVDEGLTITDISRWFTWIYLRVATSPETFNRT